jgi:hypothetical protein
MPSKDGRRLQVAAERLQVLCHREGHVLLAAVTSNTQLHLLFVAEGSLATKACRVVHALQLGEIIQWHQICHDDCSLGWSLLGTICA